MEYLRALCSDEEGRGAAEDLEVFHVELWHDEPGGHAQCDATTRHAIESSAKLQYTEVYE